MMTLSYFFASIRKKILVCKCSRLGCNSTCNIDSCCIIVLIEILCEMGPSVLSGETLLSQQIITFLYSLLTPFLV